MKSMDPQNNSTNLNGVAIVGLAGRFPGADSAEEFWENLKKGVESISRFTAGELEVRGSREGVDEPNYIPARAILNGIDQFDAAFFGMLPRDAELLDPQHRVFLECCWEAIENAGYDPLSMSAPVGVFAGCSPNSYFLTQVARSTEFIEDYAAAYQVGHYAEMLGAIADTLATRVSYKLNLRGPSITMMCACSTSLVAVCQAYTSLLTYQCDVALAGGVSITLPQKRGYLYEPGGMVSPDGHCRTFDADAQGTVFGSGAGVVLLKRLEDAVSDGDHIYAVIKGTAVNNDGAGKVGFTAPSVEGQASVIAMAQAAADIEPRTIGYVEAHGTATPLGDPIELEALTQVFRGNTRERGFCAIGTAKTNVGHLDVAAGVTGLIKTALSLKHRQLPPTLHFRRPNPKLDLENSPFFVNTELRDWKPLEASPLRAGVSAFGVGGTNAHVVLEEAPPVEVAVSGASPRLICLSAKSEEALQQGAQRLLHRLEADSGIDLAHVAYTLQTGRKGFDHRWTAICKTGAEAIQALRAPVTGRHCDPSVSPHVHFLFPGQGVQHVNMGRELYESEPVFRKEVDRCCEILESHSAPDLRRLMYPGVDGGNEQEELRRTQFAQPAIFVTEYALARLWMHWGILPQSMVGHSVGEFVAACLAGVLSLEDALGLIAARGRMISELPAGAMLAARLPEEELAPLLNGSLSVAAVNAPSLCVLSGSLEAIADLEAKLGERRVAYRRLQTSHAFHSAMMDPILAPFAEYVGKLRLSAPNIPYVSGVTGDWITGPEAVSPDYWARHLRLPVQFSSAIRKLREAPGDVLLEVGPGSTLQSLARQHPSDGEQLLLSSLPGSERSSEGNGDTAALLQALGRLWEHGVPPKWAALYSSHDRRRVPLPTYAFQKKRYWINGGDDSMSTTQTGTAIVTGSEPIAPPAIDRKLSLAAEVIEIFRDLSGLEADAIDPAATFLELGFDSLFLTQAAQSVGGRFGTKVTFRQLMDEQSTVRSLAEYLDAKLPAAKPTQPAPVAVRVPAGGSAPATPVSATGSLSSSPLSDNSMERLFKDQLDAMSRLMTQQIEMLRGSEPAVAPAVSPAAQTSPAPRSEVSVPPVGSQGAAGAAEFKPFGPYKPIQKGPAGGLTPQQQTYLDALIARYTARTGESKRLTQRYRKVLADPRVAAGFRSQWKEMVYPLVTNRSKGSRLWDVDGNEYIDLLNGFGPIALGHMPDFVADAVAQQLREGIEIGPQTPLAGEVAEALCEMTGMERATFCNTGSEAVMAALRVARTVTGRKKVVLFAGAYHGNFEEVLVKNIGRHGTPRTGPIAPGVLPEAVANVIVLEYGAKESIAYIREHAAELAAVLVEPVQSRHPSLQPREFLREIREITLAAGTALIFDEIVTGFRIHQGGAQAYFGIQADMATYGKVLGGGLPIGALAGTAQFMDALDGGMWNYGDASYPEVGVTFFAGTFVRHPLAMAAARAVLRHLKSEGPGLQETLANRTTALVGRINALFERYHLPSRAENCASIFYFSFPSDFRFGSLLYYHLREKGVHIQEGFPCFLTTAHSEADVAHILRAFEESAEEMHRGGVLPLSEDEAAHSAPAAAPREAPLTEAQLEVWLSAQLSSEASCAFNEAFTIELRGELNLDALRSSLQEIVDRHEVLRATFSGDGKTIHFSPELRIDIPLIDLSSSGDAKAALDRLVDEDARTPFDLATGPLVRIRLVRIDPRRHIVLFTSHHIVCDGWSTNVIVDELGRIYSAKVRSTPVVLDPVYPFGDYARARQAEEHSARQREVETFWTNQFVDLPPVLDLPVDRPRPAVKEFAGATYRKTIGPELYKNVKRAGAKQGCTLFGTLLSAFQALLFRLTGQHDVVVGIPAAAQSLVEGKALVGHCVNFLALRGRLEDGTTFSEFLSNGRRALLDAYEHQTYTYGTLVRKLAVPRDPSRLPLIEVQFNLERVGAGVHFEGLQASIDSCSKRFVNFDLFLNVVEGAEGLVLDCDYNTGLFDEATIDRWLGHYATLLAAIAEDPRRPVLELPLMSEAELGKLIAEGNTTRAEYPKQACVHELFEKQALLTPDAIAVQFGERTATYAELNEHATELGNYLAKQGIGPDQLVAICLERSLDMLVALLGVLKAGAAYVPLDPGYPKDRIEFILEEADIKMLLSHERVATDLGAVKTRVVCLDTEWQLVADQSRPAPRLAARSNDLAYVIYTSGSTGKPKGVEIQHRAVVNFLCSMQQRPGIAATDRLLSVTTISFDIAVLELLLPLVSGARVVIAGKDAVADGAQLAQLIAKDRISILQATPSTWRLLLEAGWKPAPSLRILCGGEALPRDLADELLAGGGEVWNMYGPTETTIWSAVSLVNRGPGPVLLGSPIANTFFYVLDRHRQPVPFGVVGELYIGGDGVARGYYRRPDLTEGKFFQDPFQEEDAGRMYSTGDLVRALPGGMFEFLGRLDNQVKIRGFRIELGEIEAVLGQHSAVKEAIVVARTDGGASRLVAYFSGHAVAAEELKRYAALKLPAYMVPSFFVQLPQIPRTPNGKVDRRALPAPSVSAVETDRAYRAPRNGAEESLIAICSGVLRLAKMGIDDNLFELGADSIQIFQIVARANRAGFAITAQQLLRNPTVAGLSASNTGTQPAPSNGDLNSIRPGLREKYRIRRTLPS